MKVTAPDQKLPLDFINKKIRLVIIDCAYDTIENPLTQSLLAKIVCLKILGYRKEYPYGALPVDSGDFTGVHLLACEETANGLEPFMGFKSVSLDRCITHNLDFPAHHICSTYTEHNNAIDQMIERAKSARERVAYNGSWTVDQSLRNDRQMIQLCYDLTLTLLVKYYTEYGFKNIIAGATKRFSVEKFKEFMGFEYLKHNGEKLPSIPCTPFFNEMIDVMYLRQFSDAAHALAKRYDALWENRLTLAADLADVKKKAA